MASVASAAIYAAPGRLRPVRPGSALQGPQAGESKAGIRRRRVATLTRAGSFGGFRVAEQSDHGADVTIWSARGPNQSTSWQS